MKDGDFVKISYVGRIKETNEIFDLTDEELAKKEKIHNPKMNYGPVTVILGEKMLLAALEDEIKGMKPGEKKTFELGPDKAFGERDQKLVKVFNEAEFRRNDMNPTPGLNVNINGLRGKVLSASGGRIRVDFNHPLSGKNLVYDMTVEEVVEKNEDKVKAILQYHTGVKPESLGVQIGEKEIVVNMPPQNAATAEAKEKASTEMMKWIKVDSIKFEEIFKKKAE